MINGFRAWIICGRYPPLLQKRGPSAAQTGSPPVSPSHKEKSASHQFLQLAGRILSLDLRRRGVRQPELVDRRVFWLLFAPNKNLGFCLVLRDKLHMRLVCIKQFIGQCKSLERRRSVSDRRMACVNTSCAATYWRRRSESDASRLPQATQNKLSKSSPLP